MWNYYMDYNPLYCLCSQCLTNLTKVLFLFCQSLNWPCCCFNHKKSKTAIKRVFGKKNKKTLDFLCLAMLSYLPAGSKIWLQGCRWTLMTSIRPAWTVTSIGLEKPRSLLEEVTPGSLEPHCGPCTGTTRLVPRRAARAALSCSLTDVQVCYHNDQLRRWSEASGA